MSWKTLWKSKIKKLEGSLQAKAFAHRACAALFISEGAMSGATCDALPSFPLFATTVLSVRIAFFPARFRQARKRRCAHEETLARARSRCNLRPQASD